MSWLAYLCAIQGHVVVWLSNNTTNRTATCELPCQRCGARVKMWT